MALEIRILNMVALIVGYGVSGKAVARVFESIGKKYLIFDEKKEGFLKDLDASTIKTIDLAILSPGFPSNHPIVQKLKHAAIETIGEIEFGIRQLQNRAFAITGSNGKTTAVLLTEHILNHARIPAKAIGNVGKSVSEYLLEKKEEIMIVELSSFQLEQLKTPCFEMGVILNIIPNHLDRYPF